MPDKKQFNPGYQVGTDFISSNQIKEIDFATIHAYPDLWLPGQSEDSQLAFVQRWISSHWTDAQMTIRKPLVFAEFGKSKKDPGYSLSARDSYINSVYNNIYNDAKNGGSFAGGMVWQIMAEGMESYYDGYEIVLSQNPSTAGLISAQSQKMTALARSLKNTSPPLALQKANTSPHTTARVTKRPLEDDDVLHRIKQQRLVRKVADKASTELLSKEEQKLFRLDRWFRSKSLRRHQTPKYVTLLKDFYTQGLFFIREAYLSVSGIGSEDMMELLKDEVAMRALLQFAYCLSHMREYSLCMQAIRTDLLMKLETDGIDAHVPSAGVSLMSSAKPWELERNGGGKAISCSVVHIEGDDRFFVMVYNMLLILNEMLAQMGFQSKDVEGYGHAELTEIVQDRMSLLRIEMEQSRQRLC
ncbi:Mannan endo-1,4-beta-mannosidase [Thalictrum thalictroides]|uniref:mannan endo-1,4-beta-mannosidase n=1 Tax=Thalictrum thalictroides TaxID=46969 RepID=A0A7J6XD00_THATH|nr:Mannan endo-1,4-beta-mannosidase [Thalictrum thalictroides]